MIVSGKPIAQKILEDVRQQIETNHLHPDLAIILAGENPASRMYIKHKTKVGAEIGINVITYEFAASVPDECMRTIDALNNDPQTNGIIVQLPLYPNWVTDNFVNRVAPQKDVDGFVPRTPFIPATAEATWEMLSEFARLEGYPITESFLQGKKIVVLGKGKTAGKPVRELLKTKGFDSALIDSKTKHPDDIIRESDIIVSATGKKNIINATNVKDSSYVIGIGVGKEIVGDTTKTFGDIDEEGIENRAKLICPTIGGIGPLTIACLLRNVSTATLKQASEQ